MTALAAQAASGQRPAASGTRVTTEVRCFPFQSLNLVAPDLESVQLVGAEGAGQRHVAGVAPACNQYAADAGHVVARIEGVPAVTQESLEPTRKVHRAVRRQGPDIAEVAGAIAGRNVQAAA